MTALSLASQTVCFVTAAFGFSFGAYKSFKKKGILFLQIVTCALGCAGLGFAFNIVSFLTTREIPQGFNIGILGMIGCYFFLLSAGYGQLDGLGDSGSKAFRKYRLMALGAPFLILVAVAAVVFTPDAADGRLVPVMLLLVMAPSSYYNLKHLIIPDIDLGILKAIRSYNIMILLFTAINTVSILLGIYGLSNLANIASLANAIVIAFIMPISISGVKKWYI